MDRKERILENYFCLSLQTEMCYTSEKREERRSGLNGYNFHLALCAAKVTLKP